MVKLNPEFDSAFSLAALLVQNEEVKNPKFHAFIVRPLPGFTPRNWREKPEHYQILSYEGSIQFKGRADAWLFIHNKERALENNAANQWAICLN